MKEYIKAELQVIRFEAEDILTGSPNSNYINTPEDEQEIIPE